MTVDEVTGVAGATFDAAKLHGRQNQCAAPNAVQDNLLARFGRKDPSLNRERVTGYLGNWGDKARLGQDDSKDVENRRSVAQELTRSFYDIVTDFYEYGWGQSFHFARTFQGDPFNVAIARHEQYLAWKLSLRPGQCVLDVGCGVGGPLREIAKMTSAHITGINANEYQIQRCKMYSKALNLEHLTSFHCGDFTRMPFQDNMFDNAYCIEAAVHSPRLEMAYSEVYRTLKPGGMFACYEWCVTPAYDPDNIEQKRIIFNVEKGNSISKLYSTDECLAAARSAGFEIIEADDLAVLRPGEVPWYDTLKGAYSLSQFRMTRLGRWTTEKLVHALEVVRIAPPGARDVCKLLNSAADNLVVAGELGIFTPMFFWLGRKPDN